MGSEFDFTKIYIVEYVQKNHILFIPDTFFCVQETSKIHGDLKRRNVVKSWLVPTWLNIGNPVSRAATNQVRVQ